MDAETLSIAPPLMRRGMLIVLDGIDGSGKTTQTQLLCERLEALGHKVFTPNFPRYDKESSYFVRKLLKGDFEAKGSVNPHVASMFYAFDRMDAAPEMLESLERGDILLSNRYTSSNVGHQGGRFDDTKERKAYYAWLDHFEYEQLGIPRPDVVLYLHVPVEVSVEMIHNRFLTSNMEKKDIYESDVRHLRQAYKSYNEAAALFSYWKTIECMDKERFMSPEEVHERIWGVVEPLLLTHVSTRAGSRAA